MQLSANTQVKTIEGALRTHTRTHAHTRHSASTTPIPHRCRSPPCFCCAGHYTGHFKAVVTKPQNVMIMRDIACAGYVAGCNTQFFACDRSENGKTFSMSVARGAIMDRLSFADDATL